MKAKTNMHQNPLVSVVMPVYEHTIKSDKLFFHFYRYMFRHCSESRYWLFFNRRYYAAFLKRDLKYACKRVLHFNKR